MAKTVLDSAGDFIDESTRRASQVSSTVASAVGDGLYAAKRAGNEGRQAVDDLLEDTTKRVKRSPMKSVMVALVVGVALGFLIAAAAKDA